MMSEAKKTEIHDARGSSTASVREDLDSPELDVLGDSERSTANGTLGSDPVRNRTGGRQRNVRTAQ